MRVANLLRKYLNSYRLDIVRTFIFTLRFSRRGNFFFIGKGTTFKFAKTATFNITGNLYIDCRNEGQFFYPSVVSVGANSRCNIGCNVNFFSGATVKISESAHLSIGSDTYLSGPVTLFVVSSVRIGAGCSIAWGVTVIDSNFHSVDITSPVRVEPVVIGNDVWIGCNVTILPGVILSDRSIVGAGSVVLPGFYSPGVYAGNPAKLIRLLN